MLIAFLENNLCADGSVKIPEALRMYMGGMEEIDRDFCPRRSLHVFIRSVLLKRSGRGTVRQSGPVRPALPAALL